MTDIFFDVIIAIFNAVTTFVTGDYFFSLFSEKNCRFKVLKATAFTVFLISPLVFKMTPINMITLIACVFIISLGYNFRLYNKILFTALFIVINSLLEVAVIMLFSLMTGNNSATVLGGAYFVFGALFTKLLFIILCYIIGTMKKKVLIGKFSFKWISLYSLPIATYLVALALYYSSFYFKEDPKLQTVSFLGLVLLILSNFLIIKLVNDIHDSAVNGERLKMAEELVKHQEKQYSLIFENNEKIAKQRHDYKNFVIGLLSEFKDGEYESVRKRLEGELDELSSMPHTPVSGNSIIDTLVGYKVSEAKDKGITMNFDYRNISKLCMSGIDLSVLLGNALDNAVEASEKLSDSSRKVIDVFAVVKGETVIITVTNNVDERVDVDNLKSTKDDAHVHGFGIINMKALAKKYGGEVVFVCENGKFKTIIEFENRKETAI